MWMGHEGLFPSRDRDPCQGDKKPCGGGRDPCIGGKDPIGSAGVDLDA